MEGHKFNVSEPGLPVGAVDGDEWQREPLKYRVVFGVTHRIEGMYDLVGTVRAAVIQLADGTIDDGSKLDPPLIHLSIEGGTELTAAQARELAQRLNAAAVEAEQMSVTTAR